jgi:hypothetical protein
LAAVLISALLGAFSVWSTKQQLHRSDAELKQARHAEEMDERPWLLIEDAGVDTGELPGFFVKAKNTGRTPATQVHFLISGGRPHPPQLDLFRHPSYTREWVESTSLESGAIPPGAEYTYKDFSFSGLGLPQQVGNDMADSIRRSVQGKLILVGGVAYTDAYGTDGFSQFCVLLVNGKYQSNCGGSNTLK